MKEHIVQVVIAIFTVLIAIIGWLVTWVRSMFNRKTIEHESELKELDNRVIKLENQINILDKRIEISAVKSSSNQDLILNKLSNFHELMSNDIKQLHKAVSSIEKQQIDWKVSIDEFYKINKNVDKP